MPVLGVAIPIPEPHHGELARARHAAGDPMADAIPPHVTLLPPTEVIDGEVDAFVDHLASVAATHPSFAMRLSGTASFRPISPVVFVQVSEGISSCERLERAVRSGPVERRLDFNYHPHVTIAHHVDDASLDLAARELAQFVAEFDVDGFELYERGDDEVWRAVRSFGLTG